MKVAELPKRMKEFENYRFDSVNNFITVRQLQGEYQLLVKCKITHKAILNEWHKGKTKANIELNNVLKVY